MVRYRGAVGVLLMAALAPCHFPLCGGAAAGTSDGGVRPGVKSAPSRSGRDRPGEVLSRLAELQSRLERLEGKLDRLEALLQSVHGERLRRIESVQGDPELVSALRRLAERYRLRGAANALASDDVEAIVDLQRKLPRSAAAAAPGEFARDPDVARLVAAMAQRRDYATEHAHGLVVSVTGMDAEGAGALVSGMLDLAEAPGQGDLRRAVRETALWGAFRAKGPGLAERLSEDAREAWESRTNAGPEGGAPALSRAAAPRRIAAEGSTAPARSAGEAGASCPAREAARLLALTLAAAASHGDDVASGRLAKLVHASFGEDTGTQPSDASEPRAKGETGLKVTPRLANMLAWQLTAAGSKVAFRIHVELVRDQAQGFAAAQAMTRIVGLERRIAPNDIRQNREKLYQELRSWLDKNWSKLRYDERLRRFTIREEPGTPKLPPQL